jgi:hypothetical protein
MKLIELHSKKYPGYKAIVDDEDYEEISKYTCCLKIDPKNNIPYALIIFGKRPTRKHIRMHRFIMKLHEYNIEKKLIDHEDHNGLNNQKYNLRICTYMDNNANARKTKNNTTSQFKGVSWHKLNNKWIAHVQFNRKLIHLGYFFDEKEAALAYNKKATELFGEFAFLNIII